MQLWKLRKSWTEILEQTKRYWKHYIMRTRAKLALIMSQKEIWEKVKSNNQEKCNGKIIKEAGVVTKKKINIC